MKAMILLGCPEAPAQTPLAVYASYKLNQMGYETTIVSNPAAGKLLDVCDPEHVYIKNREDIDRTLEDLEEGDYDLLLGLVHKDAAATFFVTYSHILQTKAIALIFSRDVAEVEEFVDMVASSTDAEIVAAKAYHNPTPIRVKLDKALKNFEIEE